MPKSVKVQSLAKVDGPDDPSAGPSETMVTIPDPGSVFTIGLDVIVSCYFMVKAKYKGPVASPENKNLDSKVATSASGVSDASATLPDARVTANL
ncbi:uncharacterized protein PGTG_20468, partial [Puccinia graminis f. sp. tritici CRL 75-36-700-3]